MTNADYARIHYRVAVSVWQDSERWLPLFPTYDQYTALRVDAASLALDLAVAQECEARAARMAGV